MSLDLENTHKAMLDAISGKYQKTAGFPAYDFTRAFALAVLSLDGDISTAEARQNVDNLTGIDLDEFVRQHRGLTRKYATYAEATLRVVSGAGTIQAGDLFSTISGVEFYATTDTDCTVGTTFPVRASLGGASGNAAAGTILYMPVTIAGIGSVTNDAAASGGYDAESDDDFRDRYYAELQTPNNGSNRQAYLEWALSVAGVGRAKVFPLASGDNTVEVCIVGADMTPAAASIVAAVQETIDPGSAGTGEGQAPIGAYCTVTSAAALTVNVACTVTVAAGYESAAVLAAVKAALTAYLASVAFVGETVSYAKVGNCIIDAAGVSDYSGLTINGGTASITLGDRQVPVLGTVSIA